MIKLNEILEKVNSIFTDDGLKTEHGIIKAKELNFKIFNENDTLVLDFLGSLPEITITKNLVITNVLITLKITRIDFISDKEIKLYFDGFPWHRTLKHD